MVTLYRTKSPRSFLLLPLSSLPNILFNSTSICIILGALALLVGTHASKIDPHHGKTKCATIWDKMKPQFSGILREIVLIDSVDDVKVDVLVKGLLVAAEEKVYFFHFSFFIILLLIIIVFPLIIPNN